MYVCVCVCVCVCEQVVCEYYAKQVSVFLSKYCILKCISYIDLLFVETRKRHMYVSK